jgi:glycosyltransferase involved in cell wall biosynthesis
MPKLSIITINYNNLGGLQRTVQSVVNQTWQELEYSVIEG